MARIFTSILLLTSKACSFLSTGISSYCLLVAVLDLPKIMASFRMITMAFFLKCYIQAHHSKAINVFMCHVCATKANFVFI